MIPIKVLIVEDEILIAETIRMYLLERGHSATGIVISFDEAVEAFEREAPDVVLLDVRLYGEKSGIDFAKYLISKDKKTPFVFLTSQFDKRIVENAMKTNPNGYLTKPIQKQSLWTTTELAYSQQLNVTESETTMHINDGTKTHVIDGNDIMYVNSDHVYINIYLKDEKPVVVRNSLAQFLMDLVDPILLRCHRSYAINIKHVEAYNTNYVVIDGKKIPLSRSLKHDVYQKIKLEKG